MYSSTKVLVAGEVLFCWYVLLNGCKQRAAKDMYILYLEIRSLVMTQIIVTKFSEGDPFELRQYKTPLINKLYI
jgi:hypothetical protein